VNALQLPDRTVRRAPPPAIDHASAVATTAEGSTAVVPPVTTPAAGSQRSAPRCTDKQVTVAFGNQPGAATGEHSFTLEFTNTSRRACSLTGRPLLRLRDGDGNSSALREDKNGAGAQYVHGAATGPVVLAPGAGAHVLVAKYRCDLSPETTATTVTVRLPGSAKSKTLQLLPGAGIGDIAWCADPEDTAGRTYALTPFQPGPAP
jgi:hypothetical protein